MRAVPEHVLLPLAMGTEPLPLLGRIVPAQVCGVVSGDDKAGRGQGNGLRSKDDVPIEPGSRRRWLALLSRLGLQLRSQEHRRGGDWSVFCPAL